MPMTCMGNKWGNYINGMSDYLTEHLPQWLATKHLPMKSQANLNPSI